MRNGDVRYTLQLHLAVQVELVGVIVKQSGGERRSLGEFGSTRPPQQAICSQRMQIDAAQGDLAQGHGDLVRGAARTQLAAKVQRVLLRSKLLRLVSASQRRLLLG